MLEEIVINSGVTRISLTTYYTLKSELTAIPLTLTHYSLL